jgi:hypothetical protein
MPSTAATKAIRDFRKAHGPPRAYRAWAEADAWLPAGSKRSDVLFRTGFGDLLVWDGTFIWLVLVHLPARMTVGTAIDRLVGYVLQRPTFYANDDLPAMMDRARKEAGPLEPDEMYNYVPALALGGTEETARVVKVKAKEALDILAQVSPVQDYGI